MDLSFFTLHYMIGLTLVVFSFDEVQKYLQQHFSSVEESRFVDDGDRAELYALYINCLEVKLEKCCLNCI